MKNQATEMSLTSMKDKLAKGLINTTKIVAGSVIAAGSTSAFAAGFSDGLNNASNLGVLFMNVVLILAACGGAYLAITGMWALKPGGQQSQTTPAQAWGKVGVGILLVNALWFINEGSKEFTGEQSETFNSNVNGGSGA